jgi:hypothetical protein
MIQVVTNTRSSCHSIRKTRTLKTPATIAQASFFNNQIQNPRARPNTIGTKYKVSAVQTPKEVARAFPPRKFRNGEKI